MPSKHGSGVDIHVFYDNGKKSLHKVRYCTKHCIEEGGIDILHCLQVPKNSFIN